MDEYCRLCATKNNNLTILLEIANITRIRTLLKIEEDGFPQKICDSCIFKINDINTFISKCEESYEYFKNNFLKYVEGEYKNNEDIDIFKSNAQESSENEETVKESPKVKIEIKTENEEIHHDYIRRSECLVESESSIYNSSISKNKQEIELPMQQKPEKNDLLNLLENDNSHINTSSNPKLVKRNNSKKYERRRKTRNCNAEISDGTSTWKCQFCPRIFTTDKILRRHMQNIHTNPNFKCIKCGFECTNKSNCAGHVKRKHFKELKMEFEELLQFVLEKDSNTNDAHFFDLPFPCDCCTRSFAKETDLQKHKNRVHISDPEASKLFGCKKCGSKYTYRKTAVKHIRNVHYESRTELVKAEIDEYLIQYGQPRIEPDITKTAKKENIDEGTVHECPVCHLKYSRAIILKSHFARFHLSEDEKKKRKKKVYLCQQCGKKFSARSAFQYHVQTHFGEKKFKCNECSKAYYTKHLLLSHMRKHTGDMSNRQLECEICHKKWPSKTALERHMNVHGQKQPRNFMCSICGNAFYSNYHLKSHMLRHTKENNFKCTEPGCNASFRADGSRKKHFHNFHLPDDQKPFSCDICQKKFFRKSYLSDHLRKHGKAGENILNLYRQKIHQD
ncbi:oocyte zinc finger protein XlCOF6-like [Condylostylus longicornis]|uniref:oocyte zinc finger protein XlCOF6-like n=1 Tax=Condylostylus longicornis TaxID=2530218 RepID=UPI00244DA042|nr:oocyte zinc finger protein XlCOF6-like [Condylostylus longicornis]